MGKFHAKGSIFKIDNMLGAVTDISVYLDTVKLSRKRDRPQTATFGDIAEREQVLGLKAGDISLAGFWEQQASGKLHGKATRLLLDFSSIYTALNKGKVTRKANLPDTSTFGSVDRTFDVIGLGASDIQISGYHDGTAGQIDAIFQPILDLDPSVRAQAIATFGMNGYAAGNPVEMFTPVEMQYDVDGGENKTVDLALTFKGDDQVDLGYSLFDIASVISGAAPVSGTAVDDSIGASSNGGVAHLHVIAATGLTTVTFKVQHSPDNSTWADLVTFNACTAVSLVGGAAQRVVVAPGTTVNRYTRGQLFAGTYTNVTANVSFARRSFVNIPVFGTHKHFCALYGNQLNAPQPAAAPWVFEYDPEGTAVGNIKFTGTFRFEQYDITFDENAPTKFSATLRITGAVTTGSN